MANVIKALWFTLFVVFIGSLTNGLDWHDFLLGSILASMWLGINSFVD